MTDEETQVSDQHAAVGGTSPDRLTLILVGVALLLFAVLAGIVVDLLARPVPDVSLVSETPGLEASPSGTPLPPSVTPTRGTPPPCVAPADWGIHIVAPGDTLYSLAEYYGTDLQALMQVNCLDRSSIFVDERLYVPGPRALPTFATSTAVAAETPPAGTPQPLGVDASGAPTEGERAASVPSSEAQPTPIAQSQNRFLNVVLLGIDKRPEDDVGVYLGRQVGITRADAIIIVSVDVQDNIVRLLHVPRDLWVQIPAYGEERINTAYTWAELEEKGTGPERMKQTIYQNLGIPIHYYIEMDFQGFINIIDALGGVQVDVSCPLPEIGLEPGVYHLDGAHVMQYVHRRDSSDDFDRGSRQSQILMALYDQALTPGIVTKIPQLWLAMGDNFKTDLPLDQVVSLAYMALQITPRQIRRGALDYHHVEDWVTPGGAMVLRPRQDKIDAFLADFYAPLDTTPSAKVEKVGISVLNGSQRFQAEELASAALKRAGFKIVEKGGAGGWERDQTQIILRRGERPVAEKIARELGTLDATIQDETGIPDRPNPSDRTDVRIILGTDYDPCQR
jgi:LCP family protein required for cell wall assembly